MSVNTPKISKKIPCPECSKKLEWSTENPYRPFCSERCKVLDLGAWATEDYQIPAEINAEEDDFSTGMVELEGYVSRMSKTPITH